MRAHAGRQRREQFAAEGVVEVDHRRAQPGHANSRALAAP